MPMLLLASELPSIEPAVLGQWLLAGGTVLWLYGLWKRTFPAKPPAQQYVTKGEMDALRMGLMADMKSLKDAFTTQHDRLETYVHSRLKELSDDMGSVKLKLEEVHRSVQRDIFEAVRYLSGHKYPTHQSEDSNQGQE